MSTNIINLTTYPALVGSVMRHMRKARNISQRDAAQYLGVKQPAYSRLESGGTVLSVTQLSRICEFFKITPSEFLEKVEFVKSSLIEKGVRVEHGQSYDIGKALINVLAGAALGVLIAKLLSGE